ncbi:MAG: 16S rRNA (uracil(1498)-N(3))-methyltransferase [Magnetococcales bacterium]|nr:16S rRNA (uracil(1498)-N(3))-methyltransferase [Magnetococcales bacterium]
MMKPRLFIKANLENGLEIELDHEMRNYLVNTLRRERGTEVFLFNDQDDQLEWEATLVETHPRGRLLVHHSVHVSRESPLKVTLVSGLLKGEAMDWIIQKATELGVDTFIPLQTERTVARITENRWPAKERRWRKIVQEAAELSRRVRLMKIHPPVMLEQLSGLLPQGPRCLFWEEDQGPRLRLRSLPHPGTKIILMIGSEGGFSVEEVRRAEREMGFQLFSLGSRVIRAETAAIAVVAAAQILWGE